MTIYDIAKEAGCSASTVSRVINNKPGIRRETRERVRELLEKYNYSPDIAARGLVKQSSGLIGILIEDLRVLHHLESAFIIEREMMKLGYCCIIMPTGFSPETQEEYIRVLEQRRAEGAVLVGSMFMTETVKAYVEKYLPKIPVVIVNGYLDLPNVTGIIADEREGIGKTVDLLYSKGKRNIAFALDGPTVSNLSKQEGYLDGMRKYGLEPRLFESKGKTQKEGEQITREILSAMPDMDAIIYSVDLTAVGGIHAAVQEGYRVPEDLSIVGVDNSIYCDIARPRLTSLNNKVEESSETAAAVLIEGIRKKPVHRKIILFTDIVERETT